jgi:hypothetical protein
MNIFKEVHTPELRPQQSTNISGIGTLDRTRIADTWDPLIGGACGMGNEIFEVTQKLITKSAVPDVSIKIQNIAPGLMQGMAGRKKPFLVLSNTGNPKLKRYRMYICTTDYGNNLQVFWCITFEPTILQRLASQLVYIPIIGLLFLPIRHATGTQGSSVIAGLDLFDELELKAYVTNTYHCLQEAVDTVCKGRGVDTSKIDRKPRGFLGIS